MNQLDATTLPYCPSRYEVRRRVRVPSMWAASMWGATSRSGFNR